MASIQLQEKEEDKIMQNNHQEKNILNVEELLEEIIELEKTILKYKKNSVALFELNILRENIKHTTENLKIFFEKNKKLPNALDEANYLLQRILFLLQDFNKIEKPNSSFLQTHVSPYTNQELLDRFPHALTGNNLIAIQNKISDDLEKLLNLAYKKQNSSSINKIMENTCKLISDIPEFYILRKFPKPQKFNLGTSKKNLQSYAGNIKSYLANYNNIHAEILQLQETLKLEEEQIIPQDGNQKTRIKRLTNDIKDSFQLMEENKKILTKNYKKLVREYNIYISNGGAQDLEIEKLLQETELNINRMAERSASTIYTNSEQLPNYLSNRIKQSNNKLKQLQHAGSPKYSSKLIKQETQQLKFFNEVIAKLQSDPDALELFSQCMEAIEAANSFNHLRINNIVYYIQKELNAFKESNVLTRKPTKFEEKLMRLKGLLRKLNELKNHLEKLVYTTDEEQQRIYESQNEQAESKNEPLDPQIQHRQKTVDTIAALWECIQEISEITSSQSLERGTEMELASAELENYYTLEEKEDMLEEKTSTPKQSPAASERAAAENSTSAAVQPKSLHIAGEFQSEESTVSKKTTAENSTATPVPIGNHSTSNEYVTEERELSTADSHTRLSSYAQLPMRATSEASSKPNKGQRIHWYDQADKKNEDAATKPVTDRFSYEYPEEIRPPKPSRGGFFCCTSGRNKFKESDVEPQLPTPNLNKTPSKSAIKGWSLAVNMPPEPEADNDTGQVQQQLQQ
jgi:hypothetical protein